MEFHAKEDINATVEEVFALLADIDSIERQAIRRGIEVRRTTGHTTLTQGMAWAVGFEFRGRRRDSVITVSELDRPNRIVFDSETGGLDTHFEIDLMQMSKAHTRVTLNATMSARTLSARLLVQSLKLAKARINRKFEVRVSQLARDLEERAARLA